MLNIGRKYYSPAVKIKDYLMLCIETILSELIW